MRIFPNDLPMIAFRWPDSDFEYLYQRLLPVGLVAGVMLLGVSTAYLLVNFSVVFAILAILAVPLGLVLVTRPQLGLLLVIFTLSFEDFSNSGPGVSALKLLSVVVFGGAIVHFLVFRRRESLANVPQNWLILFFIGSILLSNFVAINPSRTVSGTSRLLRVLTLYLMVINLIQTKKSLNYLIWVFLISGLISAVWGLLDPAQVGQRLFGTMGQPNVFAAAMVPRLALALGLLTIEKGLLKRVSLLIILAVIAYATILSGSRGGLLGVLLALFLFVLTQKNKIAWFGIIGFLIVIGFIAMPLEIKARVGLIQTSATTDELGNSTDRRETYQVYGWQVWQENPVLGVGLDGFAEAYTRSDYRFLQKNQTKRVAHNTYLEIGVGTGLVGFIPFMLLLAVSLYKTWKYASYMKLDPYLACVAAGLFAAQGGFFLSMLFGSRQYDKLLWLLIALAGVIQVLISAAERRQALLPQQSQQNILPQYANVNQSFT